MFNLLFFRGSVSKSHLSLTSRLKEFMLDSKYNKLISFNVKLYVIDVEINE